MSEQDPIRLDITDSPEAAPVAPDVAAPETTSAAAIDPPPAAAPLWTAPAGAPPAAASPEEATTPWSIEELTGPSDAVPPARVQSGGRFGARWAVALVVVALVVAATAAGAWLLAGRDSTSQLAGWVPSDSVVYYEVRLDLPGDQRQQLGNVLAHFPGFKDQAILDDKIAEAFDRAIRPMTGDRHDYSNDIRPWFAGEVALSIPKLPPLGAPDVAAGNGDRGLLVVSTKDRAATESWLSKLVAEGTAKVTEETYKGTVIRSGTARAGATPYGYAVTDRVLLLGDVPSVKAALDTDGRSGLAANSSFSAAMGRLEGDHLVALAVNMKAYFAWMATATGAPYAGLPMPSLDPAVVAALPDWVAGDLRAIGGDAIAADMAMPRTAGRVAVPRGESVLPAHLPATTLAVVDVHDVGTSVKATLDAYRAIPSFGTAMKQVDQALGVLGGQDAAVGWIGETAIVISGAGSGVTGGVVIAPKDRAAADRLATQVKNLVALAGGSTGVTTREENHGGTTITILDGGSLERWLGAGGAGGLSVPGNLEIAFAVRDDVVAIGAPAFVRQVLDANGPTALVANTRFSNALGRVGRDSPVFGWLDVTALRTLAEGTVPPTADMTRYRSDVQPYLAPFDSVVFGSSVSGDIERFTMLLVTR